jgi:hypothetical protein
VGDKAPFHSPPLSLVGLTFPSQIKHLIAQLRVLRIFIAIWNVFVMFLMVTYDLSLSRQRKIKSEKDVVFFACSAAADSSAERRAAYDRPPPLQHVP